MAVLGIHYLCRLKGLGKAANNFVVGANINTLYLSAKRIYIKLTKNLYLCVQYFYNQSIMDKTDRYKILVRHIVNSGLAESQKDLGRKIGYKNESYFSQVINGKVDEPKEFIRKLKSVLPALNEEWVRQGEGEMLKSGQDGVQKEVPARNSQKVYLLPVSAQAGPLNDFIASVYAGQCDSILSPIAGAELALTVAGDSMTPEYPNGSIIFIKRINERAFINWGNVYLLDTCNGIIVKKVFPTEEAAVLQCVSINSNYPPFTVNMADIYGIYRVLLCMSVK